MLILKVRAINLTQREAFSVILQALEKMAAESLLTSLVGALAFRNSHDQTRGGSCQVRYTVPTVDMLMGGGDSSGPAALVS